MNRANLPYLERLGLTCPTTAELLSIRLENTAHLALADLRKGAAALERIDDRLMSHFKAN